MSYGNPTPSGGTSGGSLVDPETRVFRIVWRRTSEVEEIIAAPSERALRRYVHGNEADASPLDVVSEESAGPLRVLLVEELTEAQAREFWKEAPVS